MKKMALPVRNFKRFQTVNVSRCIMNLWDIICQKLPIRGVKNPLIEIEAHYVFQRRLFTSSSVKLASKLE